MLQPKFIFLQMIYVPAVNFTVLEPRISVGEPNVRTAFADSCKIIWANRTLRHQITCSWAFFAVRIEDGTPFSVKVSKLFSTTLNRFIPSCFLEKLHREYREFEVPIVICNHHLVPKPKFFEMWSLTNRASFILKRNLLDIFAIEVFLCKFDKSW